MCIRDRSWEREVADHYGYIKRTTGADGENVDVWVGPDAEAENPKVFVIDQVHADGAFDEHKVMFGYPNEAAALAAYLKNFPNGWKGLGDITEQDLPRFKEWLSKGDMQAPLSREGAKRKAKPDKSATDATVFSKGTKAAPGGMRACLLYTSPSPRD